MYDSAASFSENLGGSIFAKTASFPLGGSTYESFMLYLESLGFRARAVLFLKRA